MSPNVYDPSRVNSKVVMRAKVKLMMSIQAFCNDPPY